MNHESGPVHWNAGKKWYYSELTESTKTEIVMWQPATDKSTTGWYVRPPMGGDQKGRPPNAPIVQWIVFPLKEKSQSGNSVSVYQKMRYFCIKYSTLHATAKKETATGAVK